MLKLGIIGINKGNGHPYSFSAIINGFNERELKKSKWKNIYNYLKIRDKSDFGICNTKITHIWTQDLKESEFIAKCCYIDNVVKNFEDMIEEIDGVIIARDDWENHLKFAKPFLESKKYVFIDKPLTLRENELKYFENFMKNGYLFSASGIKYAIELDNIRHINDNFFFIRATCIKSWERYGIHMLDGIFSVIDWKVKNIKITNDIYVLECENNKLIEIKMLERFNKPLFKFEFFGKEYYEIEISDYFTAFRRLLWHFINMIKYNKNDSLKTIDLIKILIKGKQIE